MNQSPHHVIRQGNYRQGHNRDIDQSMKPRISMITLGVSELAAAMEFYEKGLGFPRMASPPEEAFFTLNGTWSGLDGHEALAEDAKVPGDGVGFPVHPVGGWIAVLFGMAPMVTWLMSALWRGERAFTPSRHAGMVLGLAGLTVMFATAVDIDAPGGYRNFEF